ITAMDNFFPPARGSFPKDAPARECLIRFGEAQPAGNLGTYRLWMTQATFNQWRDRPKLDNAPLDVTFVYGKDRIVYNAGALFAGSPFISPRYNTPNGELCGYLLVFPEDDRFLGETEIVLDWPDRDASKVEEQTVYWMAEQLGLPTLHRRFIHLHVNGRTEIDRGGVYEDAQQVNSAFLQSWFPQDPEGDLYKVEQWFEFFDAVSLRSVVNPTLQEFTTTGGVKKLARYRWNWLKRAIKDSANNYQNIFD